ncbi:hypothetical protein [Nocardioides daphniae]|uniref:hypothetical protein n=1 Tax=Nocardioides daphniae TaxID=402297 RepID=UPI003B8A7BEA
MGHEAVGTVLEVGDGVTGVSAGDRPRLLRRRVRALLVLSPEPRRPVPERWRLDPGTPRRRTQAELVRVPFADRALHVLPDTVTDEQAVLLADILPTAYEVGVQRRRGPGLDGRHRRRRPDRSGLHRHRTAAHTFADRGRRPRRGPTHGGGAARCRRVASTAATPRWRRWGRTPTDWATTP